MPDTPHKAPYAVGARANHGVGCGVERTKCGAAATPDADEQPHDRGSRNEPGSDAALERRGRAHGRVSGARGGRVGEQGLGHVRKEINGDESAVVANSTTSWAEKPSASAGMPADALEFPDIYFVSALSDAAAAPDHHFHSSPVM